MRKRPHEQRPPVIGKDGVGGSIPLDGTIFPYISTIKQNGPRPICCEPLQNVAEFEGMDEGEMFYTRSKRKKTSPPEGSEVRSLVVLQIWSDHTDLERSFGSADNAKLWLALQQRLPRSR